MKKIIIAILLSMFYIQLNAQNELPYKKLAEFQNDTTAFINYNFIDRADQYKGKNMGIIIQDLQISPKCIIPHIADRKSSTGGLRVCFYEWSVVDNLCNKDKTLNKPYAIKIYWEERVKYSLEAEKLLFSNNYDNILNYFKDMHIAKVEVCYPPDSEFAQKQAKLRNSTKPQNIRFEDGVFHIDWKY